MTQVLPTKRREKKKETLVLAITLFPFMLQLYVGFICCLRIEAVSVLKLPKMLNTTRRSDVPMSTSYNKMYYRCLILELFSCSLITGIFWIFKK